MTNPPDGLKANLLFFAHPNVLNCRVECSVQGEVTSYYEDRSDWRKIITSNIKESLVEGGAAVIFLQSQKEFDKALTWIKAVRNCHLKFLFSGAIRETNYCCCSSNYFRFGIYVVKSSDEPVVSILEMLSRRIGRLLKCF